MTSLHDGVQRGEAVVLEDRLLPIDRDGDGDGDVQDAWWDVHYLPVAYDLGEVCGIFCTVVEATVGILAEREQQATTTALRESEERQAFLFALGDALRTQSDADAMIEAAARLFSDGHHTSPASSYNW